MNVGAWQGGVANCLHPKSYSSVIAFGSISPSLYVTHYMIIGDIELFKYELGLFNLPWKFHQGLFSMATPSIKAVEFATEHFICHFQEPLIARFGLVMANNGIITKIKCNGRQPSFGYLSQWTPKSEWNVVSCGPKNGYKKDTCFQNHWTMCSKYNNCFRLDYVFEIW